MAPHVGKLPVAPLERIALSPAEKALAERQVVSAIADKDITRDGLTVKGGRQ